MNRICLLLIIIFNTAGILYCDENFIFGEYSKFELTLFIKKITNDDIIAILELGNYQNFDMYVQREVIPNDDNLISNCIEIYNEFNIKAEYFGIRATILPATSIDGFIVVKPYEKIIFSITLGKWYRLPITSEYLTIKYHGYLGESNLVVMPYKSIILLE